MFRPGWDEVPSDSTLPSEPQTSINHIMTECPHTAAGPRAEFSASEPAVPGEREGTARHRPVTHVTAGFELRTLSSSAVAQSLCNAGCMGCIMHCIPGSQRRPAAADADAAWCLHEPVRRTASLLTAYHDSIT